MDSFQVEAAKQFLKSRVVAQAGEETVTLSDPEMATLTYSEPSASASERELADEVEATVGTAKYEQKIAHLLRHAYDHDVAGGVKDDWERHLRALRGEDLYILVMAQSAKIPGASSVLATGIGLSRMLGLDTLCLAAVGIAGVLILFTSIGSFIKSDLVRGCAFVLWLAALWGVGTWCKRRAFRARL